MNKEEDIFRDGEFVFYYTHKEYNYIEDAIELLIKNIDNGLLEIENKIEKDIFEDDKKDSHGMKFEIFKQFSRNALEEVRFISSTINEAFLIKIYSIFEKSIINFSYEVQIKYSCKIPPDFNLRSKYNDIDTAINYIEKLSNINMKNICNYEFINNIKKLRNKLGHGNTLLNYKKEEFNSTNQIIKLLKVESSTGNDLICRVNNDVSILKEVLKEFKKIMGVLNELNFDIERCLANKWEDKLILAYNKKDIYQKRGNILGL